MAVADTHFAEAVISTGRGMENCNVRDGGGEGVVQWLGDFVQIRAPTVRCGDVFTDQSRLESELMSSFYAVINHLQFDAYSVVVLRVNVTAHLWRSQSLSLSLQYSLNP